MSKLIKCKGCGKEVYWNFGGFGWCCVKDWRQGKPVLLKFLKGIIICVYVQLLMVWFSFAIVMTIFDAAPSTMCEHPRIAFTFMIVTALAAIVLGFEIQDRLIWRRE